jgi:hypothetical protein
MLSLCMLGTRQAELLSSFPRPATGAC